MLRTRKTDSDYRWFSAFQPKFKPNGNPQGQKNYAKAEVPKTAVPQMVIAAGAGKFQRRPLWGDPEASRRIHTRSQGEHRVCFLNFWDKNVDLSSLSLLNLSAERSHRDSKSTVMYCNSFLFDCWMERKCALQNWTQWQTQPLGNKPLASSLD